jgi:hypothetical protein
MRKKPLIIGIIVVFVLIISSFAAYSPAIFQEGNPMAVAKGIMRLKLSDEKIVPIDSQRYITRTQGSNDIIISFMKDKGWSFKEQLGAGFIFEKQANSLIVVSRQYSKYFRIWTMPQI